MQQAANTLDWLKSYVISIDSELTCLFPHNSPVVLERAVSDALSGGGKRVRAILALLWCEVYTDDYSIAIPAAVAYELAHASALVQDDIVDSSSMRRGEESIVAKYGLQNAILASDLLLFNVPKMIAKYDQLENGRLAKLFDLVGEACRDATWGEFLDLELAEKDQVSELDYENMIRSKTATLLAAPAASGAIVGGAPAEDVELAYNFGEWLGMAYQVQDDMLDLIGNESALGKPVFTDLRAGKKNIALIHCFRRCSEEERTFLKSLFNRDGEYTEREVLRARTILESHGSVKYARAKSSFYIEQARSTLGNVRECEAKRSLMKLSTYLAERYY
ncbi:MAG: polyprenyl synthetase family protein [Nitrososphaerales archaeon]